MKVRAKRFVKLRVDLFDRHLLLDHASAIAFNVLKALVPLTLLALAVLGAVGQRNVWSKTLFPRLQPHLQPQTAHAIDAGAQRMFSTDSTGLIVFAALLVIWYVSGAVRAVIGSREKVGQRRLGARDRSVDRRDTALRAVRRARRQLQDGRRQPDRVSRADRLRLHVVDHLPRRRRARRAVAGGRDRRRARTVRATGHREITSGKEWTWQLSPRSSP